MTPEVTLETPTRRGGRPSNIENKYPVATYAFLASEHPDLLAFDIGLTPKQKEVLFSFLDTGSLSQTARDLGIRFQSQVSRQVETALQKSEKFLNRSIK